MKLDVYAHCTIDDVTVGGSRYLQAGGSACYCSHAARKQKFDVALHTKFGPDFDYTEHLDCLQISHVDALTDMPTTRFRINVMGPRRDLFLKCRCEQIGFTESDADGVIINPIFDEVSHEALGRIKNNYEFAFLDPQGFLRRTDQDGRIYLESTDVDLSGITMIKASPDEMLSLVGDSGLEGMRALQKRGVRYVIKTNNADMDMLDEDRLYSLRLPNKIVHDTTGIGDILGATFACIMLKERDPIWAFCFAGGSAQAALDTGEIGLRKVPHSGSTMTNASYFYNTMGFKQV